MRFVDIIASSNRNLSRNLVRTLLTISAIFIGAYSLAITDALSAGFVRYVDSTLDIYTSPRSAQIVKNDGFVEIGFNQKISEYKEAADGRDNDGFREQEIRSLKRKYSQYLVDLQPADTAIPVYITRSGHKKYVIGGSYIERGASMRLKVGRSPQGRQVVIPEDYVRPLGFYGSDDAVGKEVVIRYKNDVQEVRDYTFTVSGVVGKSLFSNSFGAAIDFDTNNEINRFIKSSESSKLSKKHRTLSAFLQPMAKSTYDEFKQKIEMDNLRITSYQDDRASFFSTINTIKTALTIFGMIALVAAAFGIVNTSLMGVLERTREIGLMKSVGASHRLIFSLFSIESLVIGFWGCFSSFVVLTLTAIIVNPWASSTFLKDYIGFTLLIITPGSLAKIMGIILTVAFLASLLPAQKAARIDPITALRYE